MYNPLSPLNIDALQQQLDVLKQQQSNNHYNIGGGIPSSPNIQEMVQKSVQEELQKILNTQQPSTPVEQPKPPVSELEQKINEFAASVLNPEQLKWLSDPVIASHIPIFFKSTKGKEAMSFLVEEYKTYVDGK
jgi:hypothetical protein